MERGLGPGAAGAEGVGNTHEEVTQERGPRTSLRRGLRKSPGWPAPAQARSPGYDGRGRVGAQSRRVWPSLVWEWHEEGLTLLFNTRSHCLTPSRRAATTADAPRYPAPRPEVSPAGPGPRNAERSQARPLLGPHSGQLWRERRPREGKVPAGGGDCEGTWSPRPGGPAPLRALRTAAARRRFPDSPRSTGPRRPLLAAAPFAGPSSDASPGRVTPRVRRSLPLPGPVCSSVKWTRTAPPSCRGPVSIHRAAGQGSLDRALPCGGRAQPLRALLGQAQGPHAPKRQSPVFCSPSPSLNLIILNKDSSRPLFTGPHRSRPGSACRNHHLGTSSWWWVGQRRRLAAERGAPN